MQDLPNRDLQQRAPHTAIAPGCPTNAAIVSIAACEAASFAALGCKTRFLRALPDCLRTTRTGACISAGQCTERPLEPFVPACPAPVALSSFLSRSSCAATASERRPPLTSSPFSSTSASAARAAARAAASTITDGDSSSSGRDTFEDSNAAVPACCRSLCVAVFTIFSK